MKSKLADSRHSVEGIEDEHSVDVVSPLADEVARLSEEVAQISRGGGGGDQHQRGTSTKATSILETEDADATAETELGDGLVEDEMGEEPPPRPAATVQPD